MAPDSVEVALCRRVEGDGGSVGRGLHKEALAGLQRIGFAYCAHYQLVLCLVHAINLSGHIAAPKSRHIVRKWVAH